MKKTVYSLIVGLFVICCHYETKQIDIVKLQKISELNVFSDQSYFSDIRFMYDDNHLLYVSDYTRGQVMILDDTLIHATISSKGKGAGELIGASAIVARSDTLFIHDEGKRTVSVFHSGEYIKNIDVPMNWDGDSRFAVFGNNLIVPSFSNPHSLAFINMSTDSLVYFGQMFDFHSPVKNRIRNTRNILLSDRHIYAVSDNQPVVERYDLEGKFIDAYNYSNIDVVKSRLSFVERQEDEENSYYILTADCYLHDNKILLLFTSTNHNGKPETNKILEIDITENMKATRLLDLGKGWYESICCISKYLWAFEKTECVLVKFEMP